MTAPTPPVPFKDHCSIIHNNILYVYSPDALQTLSLEQGAKWKQEPNGVSVRGAKCVYGGIDGDNNQSALYVVGGAANESNSNYPGLQRYSLANKSWTTITPGTPITQHRQYHAVAYMNASSGLIVYGGSQNGVTGPSSETFFMAMYPPYFVQSYPSNAPPTANAFMMPWSNDRALMVGGSTSNVNVFTFGPADGWQDLGLALPNTLPDPSVSQAALFTLDDASKILQTFTLGQNPVSITSHVLLNPGGQPASYGETPGSSTTSPAAGSKRSVILNAYPTYNSSNMPNTTRTDFSIAQGSGGLVAFVGGDANSTVGFFNQSGNSWIEAENILGVQQPLTTSTATPTHSHTSTSRPTPTASATQSTAPVVHKDSNSHGLTTLAAVLGGICGLAAILIILLLCLRNARRRKEKEAKSPRKSYLSGKKGSSEFDFEEGLHPLSKGAQPMGRSPVPSTVISEAGTATMFTARPSEKNLIRRVSNDGSKGPRPDAQRAVAAQKLFQQNKSQREKPPLAISRPMNPDLGDYGLRDRPSIDLGRATPSAPVNSTALAASSAAAAAASAASTTPGRNKSQRKTDEAWARYFTGQDINPTAGYKNQTPPSSRGGGAGGFWPGSGVPDASPRAAKFPLRDSSGHLVQAGTVNTASPNLSHGPPDSHARNLSVAQGVNGRISRASSISSLDDGSEYDDNVLDAAFSSGIPSNIPDHHWTPVGNTWSGPAQRALRPPSAAVGANDFPPPTTGTESSGNTTETKSSGIPNFPMPSSTIRAIRPSGEAPVISNVQHPAATHFATTRQPPPSSYREPSGYFTSRPAQDGSFTNDDMSWLNLGTPRKQDNPN